MNAYATKLKSMSATTNMKNNGSTALKRTRAKRSCDFCRKRKARCDADHTIPCSNCKAWGYNCEFLTVRKKRGPPSVYVENLETRCKKMESLLISLTNSSIKDIERNEFRAESYLTNNTYHYQSSIRQNVQPEDYHIDDVEAIDDDDSSLEDEDDDDSEYSNQQHKDLTRHEDISTVTMEETLANLNLDDYDSIKYTGLSAGLQLLDENLFKSKSYVQWPGRKDVALKLMSPNELLVVRADRPTSGKKRSDTRLDVGFSLSSSIFDEGQAATSLHLTPAYLSSKYVAVDKEADLPSHAVIEKAVKLYFSHIHTFLPLVNKTRFETHDMKSSNILVQAVLAVAFRFASRHFPKMFNKRSNEYANNYYRKVILHLQDSCRARLRHVQAALLMTLYLDMDETDVESMQWYTLGKAIRMAQDIGLHRSCSNWNLPPSEIETRHRVFYACYVLDRLMGARSGKPLTILDRDFDTGLPVPYEVYDDTNEKGSSIYHSFISLIKLSEILGRILKALYAPKSKHSNSNAGLDDPTILAVFDRRLKNWKATLDQSQDGVNISQAQRVNLLLFYYTTMLLLHRPFIEFSSDKDLSNKANIIHGSVDLDALAVDSRQACENAASNISVIIRQKQFLMSDPDSYSPLCLPTYFVYSMFQSSLIHLAIAIKNRDSLRKLRLLQRSITLLKKHEQLASAHRAHYILVMLVAINNIKLDNLLENDSSRDEDILAILSKDGLSHNSSELSPIANKNNSSELQSQYVTKPTITSHQQLQPVHNSSNIIPSCEDNMPKSSWYQRMMNTSIIGGITPDLYQNINQNSSSSHTLEQLLPYSYNMLPYSHNINQHRSYSNSTIYQPHENDILPHSNYYHNSSSYYSVNSPSLQNNLPNINTKRIDVYNRHNKESSMYEEAREDTRSMHNGHNDTSIPVNHSSGTTLLSHYHDHISHLPYQRNDLTATPIQSPVPFTVPYDISSTNNTSTNENGTYSINYIPPASMNWGDWDVYLGQYHPSPIPSMPPVNDVSP